MASTEQPAPSSLQLLRSRIADLRAQGQLKLNLDTSLSTEEQHSAAQALSRRSGWAWATLPDLSHLLKSGSTAAATALHLHRHSKEAGTREELAASAAHSFLAALLVSRAYCSPHATSALAQEVGVAGLYEHLAGSTVLPVASDQQVEPLRAALKARINAGWSQEAVAQGVAHTRAGQYEEAHRCYDKALELQPDNADAYVARGAAFANERQFAAAAKDFRQALNIDPNSRNAAGYLQAVQERAQQLGVSLEGEPQQPEQQQQPLDEPGSTGDQQQRPHRHGSVPDAGAAHDSHMGAGRDRMHRGPAEERDAGGHRKRSRSPRRGTNRSRSRSRSSTRNNSSSSSGGSDSSTDSGSSGLLSPGAHPSLKAALREVLKARAKSSAKKGHTSSSSKKRRRRERHEDSSSKRQRRHGEGGISRKAKHKKISSKQKSRRSS